MPEVAEGSSDVATLGSQDKPSAANATQPNRVAGKAASAPVTIHAFRDKRPGAIIPGFLAAETSKPGSGSGKPDNAV